MIITPKTNSIALEFENLKATKNKINSVTYKTKLKELVQRIENELNDNVGVTEEQSELLFTLISN